MDEARIEQVAQWAKDEFVEPDQELTVSGDDMNIYNMLIDVDEDPVEYLRSNPLEFETTVRVRVLLDEDDEVYYRLSFPDKS